MMQKNQSNDPSNRLKRLLKAALKPFFFILLSILLGAYLSFFSHNNFHNLVSTWLSKIAVVILFFSVLWLTIRFINILSQELQKWSETYQKPAITLSTPLISNALKIMAAWLLIQFSLPFLLLPEPYSLLANKFSIVFLIIFIAWFSIKLINIFEQFALKRCALTIKDNLNYRKVQTQITVLKKIAVAIIVFLAIVFMLMLSDRVRELGATLLASAGIIAAIATFAAQKTLTGVVGGVQIALTQPIHLNDMVVIENELGTIEEITLSYVVIKLQDARKLIVPVTYFIEKPFFNLSRDLKDIQGNIRLFVNYTVDIEKLRSAFQNMIRTIDQWDGKTADLLVVGTNPTQMELEFIISAQDQTSLWQLRCHLREKLIAYLKIEFPGSFL